MTGFFVSLFLVILLSKWVIGHLVILGLYFGNICQCWQCARPSRCGSASCDSLPDHHEVIARQRYRYKTTSRYSSKRLQHAYLLQRARKSLCCCEAYLVTRYKSITAHSRSKCTDLEEPTAAFPPEVLGCWTAIVRARAVFCFFLSRPVASELGLLRLPIISYEDL